MKTYRSKLNKRGLAIFKGGNIEPLSIGLYTFEAENLKKAEAKFWEYIAGTLGSNALIYYDLEEIKRDTNAF